MSFWLPKRDKHGQFNLYTVTVPFELLLILLAFFVTLLAIVLAGSF